MGKSRLLAAAEAPARKAGFAWTWTENLSYRRGEPYRWARLFAQTVADEHGIDSGGLARRLLFTDDLAPAEVRRFGGAISAIAREAAFSGWETEAADMPSDPVEIASTLREVAGRYLDRLLETTGPRVVVIDDLHFLDASSVGMVELTVDRSATAPLLVLAGTRPGPMPEWIDRPNVRRLDLVGLAESESARLATIVARAALDSEGARTIHERTAGNPLFVAETVRAFLEDGTLERRGGRVGLAEVVSDRLPVTLRAVLGARIDALARDVRETLGVASVIGVAFTEDLLSELLDGRPVAAALDRLAAAALVAPIGAGGWRFAHALIRDAAYAGMLASRRRQLHGRLADRLAVSAETASPGLIAAHRVAAGDLTRAVPLLRDAAASAHALGAVTEAAAFWRQAADLGATDDPTAAALDRARADAVGV
jgi:predicted ATPase